MDPVKCPMPVHGTEQEAPCSRSSQGSGIWINSKPIISATVTFEKVEVHQSAVDSQIQVLHDDVAEELSPS